ncbi:MAG: hypothetical protein AB7P03_07905 [Kofleriaceae bacterium]
MGLWSWITDRFAKPEHNVQRDLLAAQLELTKVARRDGYTAAAMHAAWGSSKILRRYKRLNHAPIARKLLCESVALLGSNPTPEDYQTQIDAWIEIETAAQPLPPKEKALVRCVREAAIAFHRGALPEQAMRAGRNRLPAANELPTTDITQAAKEIAQLPYTGPIPTARDVK